MSDREFRPMKPRLRLSSQPRVTLHEADGRYVVEVDGLVHSVHRDVDHARTILQVLSGAFEDGRNYRNAMLRKAIKHGA